MIHVNIISTLIYLSSTIQIWCHPVSGRRLWCSHDSTTGKNHWPMFKLSWSSLDNKCDTLLSGGRCTSWKYVMILKRGGYFQSVIKVIQWSVNMQLMCKCPCFGRCKIINAFMQVNCIRLFLCRRTKSDDCDWYLYETSSFRHVLKTHDISMYGKILAYSSR